MATVVLGQVLYADVLRAAGLDTYSGTTVSGFEPLNAFDWRDFTLFRPEPGLTTATSLALASDTVLSALAGWFVPGAHASTFTLEYETAPSVWATAGALTATPGVTVPQWTAISVPPTVAAGRKVRWSCAVGAGGCDVRLLTAGPAVTFPTGQWAGVAPPTLFADVSVENVIAINGSVLARNVRRVDRSGEINLEHLDPAWVRSTWDALVRHAARYPFWYRWAPVGYPTEVVLAAATAIEAPQNARPQPRMSARLPFRALS